MTPNDIRATVAQQLRRGGEQHARDIIAATGLRHHEVYQALVELESRGGATILGHGRRNRMARCTWEAR